MFVIIIKKFKAHIHENLSALFKYYASGGAILFGNYYRTWFLSSLQIINIF
jgi:hypothetical protein